MSSRRGFADAVRKLGLVASGAAGAIAWHEGLWGLFTGAVLLAAWSLMRDQRFLVAPRESSHAGGGTDDTDAAVSRILLDAVPIPLISIEGAVARSVNRAARQLFATDDRILPVPVGLLDPAVVNVRHEGRSWRLARVAVANGRCVVALIDIEQEERDAEARVTADMTQILGHELLNGLAPIASLAESGRAALERPDIHSDLLRDIFGTLARRAESLRRFAEAYRELARLPEPVRVPVVVAEVVADLTRLFAVRWPSIRLTVEGDGGSSFMLDRDQVSQALWALLQNAAEAGSGQDGEAEVTLTMSASVDSLVIDIRDRGAGIAPDQTDRIFRPFHTTKPGGSGIGLPLARQIAHAHGGALTLLELTPTTFRFVARRPRERTLA